MFVNLFERYGKKQDSYKNRHIIRVDMSKVDLLQAVMSPMTPPLPSFPFQCLVGDYFLLAGVNHERLFEDVTEVHES